MEKGITCGVIVAERRPPWRWVHRYLYPFSGDPTGHSHRLGDEERRERGGHALHGVVANGEFDGVSRGGGKVT